MFRFTKHIDPAPTNIEMSSNKVYVCFEADPYYHNWVIIDPPVDGRKQFDSTSELFLDRDNSIQGLRYVRRFASTAVWKSKIYFLGGLSDEPHQPYCEDVYVFDTSTRLWLLGDDFAPMGTPRTPFASVAVAPGKIYVFGGNPDDSKDLTKYAECYDIQNNSWTYLPPPPEQILYVGAYAVYDSTDGKTKRIFFRCTGGRGLVTYDFKKHEWMPLDTHSKLSKSPFWNEGAVAVVGDVLIWLHSAVIYAHDFIKDETYSLHALGTQAVFNSLRDSDIEELRLRLCPDEVPTFLFRVGDSRLCLIWNDCRNSDILHCCSFIIKNQQGCLSLEMEHLQQISTPSTRISHVSLVQDVSSTGKLDSFVAPPVV